MFDLRSASLVNGFGLEDLRTMKQLEFELQQLGDFTGNKRLSVLESALGGEHHAS